VGSIVEIIIFTNSKKTETVFSAIQKSKAHNLIIYPAEELRKTVKTCTAGSLVYIDITGTEDKDIKNTIKFLSKNEKTHFGIIDPKNKYPDPAELFFSGCTDYISGNLIKAGLTLARFKKLEAFISETKGGAETDKKTGAISAANIIPSVSWDEIKNGKEYTFCFMFIELDNQKSMKKKFGTHNLNNFVSAFHDYVEKTVSPVNGRIWMWMDFGGLILFPFNGKKCDAVLNSFKLMMDKNIASIEEYDFNTILSFRISMHIGNTVYKVRGDTGSIVSDSINSIFHLGQKHTNKGSFTLTETVFEFIPDGLKEWFVQDGEYEGRQIMKMKKLT